MADRFCDHGCYLTEGVSFLGGFSASTGTLTVTSLNPGSPPVFPGTLIDHPDLRPETYVSGAPVNGLPGTGFSQMVSANVTRSGQEITGYGGYARDPWVWGVPIEGDGTSKDKSTAAAVLSINLASASAAAGARFVLAGAELVAVASSASNNQFNAGSGATLAANLVAAINRAGNTVIVNMMAEGWTQHKVQDVFFARQDPNNAAILQIMTRAGSAAYNNNPLCQVAQSSITGLAGPYNFTGGAGGAWGYIAIPITLWPSGITSYQYGVACTNSPLAGAMLAGDVVHLRSHSKFRGTTAYLLRGANASMLSNVGAPPTNPLIFKQDNGTVWPADGVNPVLRLYCSWVNAAQVLTWGQTNGTSANWIGRKYPNGQRGIVFLVDAPSLITGNNLEVRMGSAAVWENIDFVGVNYGTPRLVSGAIANTSNRTVMRGCRILWTRQRSTLNMVSWSSTSQQLSVEFLDHVFELSEADGVQAGLFYLFPASSSLTVRTYMEGAKFIGFRLGSALLSATATSSGNSLLYMRNCDLGNVSNVGPSFRENTNSGLSYSFGGVGVIITSAHGKNVTLADTPMGMILWHPLQDMPCLNARLQDGSSWVYRIVPSMRTDNINPLNSLDSPQGAKQVTTGTGIKKLTANFLIEKTMAWTSRDISVMFTYEGVDGLPVTVWSHDVHSPATALAAGSGTWTRPGGASAMTIDPADNVERATFNDLGTPLFFNHRKIEITTPTAVKNGTEISAMLRLHRIGSYDTDQFFFDPDVQITDLVLP